ncbi:MOSC domain-containing protein [Roseobacter sinensis]|uniref:MOSC domain-containing protein n=1 Tax=Roseobacter sinensis TaxID=2931391 RepID=A0ABT3BD68_9RHOB|nr:MOSC domain-containing protein [Roseobacter sp. WL0113]MCV3271521.1 MOSC domain-containing protein [Roseobacter sp. WL0113]
MTAESALRALIARYAQPGRLEHILVRLARRAEVLPQTAAAIIARGIEGDHGASEKRAVTLVQAEHLAVIGAMLGHGPVSAQALRRNLVIAGLNLAALKGRQVALGGAILEITDICAPCSRMEEALGMGGYSAVRGHGGWCARVIHPGAIRCGDRVTPL